MKLYVENNTGTGNYIGKYKANIIVFLVCNNSFISLYDLKEKCMTLIKNLC